MLLALGKDEGVVWASLSREEWPAPDPGGVESLQARGEGPGGASTAAALKNVGGDGSVVFPCQVPTPSSSGDSTSIFLGGPLLSPIQSVRLGGDDFSLALSANMSLYPGQSEHCLSL